MNQPRRAPDTDQRTAQIIPFPLLGLSEIAVAILRDMRPASLALTGWSATRSQMA
jgi:hypothetical protein